MLYSRERIQNLEEKKNLNENLGANVRAWYRTNEVWFSVFSLPINIVVQPVFSGSVVTNLSKTHEQQYVSC